MKLLINGRELQVKSTTVEKLIKELSIPKEGLAVAVNDEIIPRAQHVDYKLNDGDNLEIIRPIGGG